MIMTFTDRLTGLPILSKRATPHSLHAKSRGCVDAWFLGGEDSGRAGLYPLVWPDCRPSGT